MHPTRTRPRSRSLLLRTIVAAIVATLVSTGLMATATPSGPIVEDREHDLSSATVRPGWTKSTDTASTQLVGFEWQGDEHGAVEVRVREEDDSWTPWTLLEGDPYEGPDIGSREDRGRTTAGPVWVGSDARKVEVRVAEGELRELKLHAIRSEDRKARSGLRPAGGATQPGIVSRAAWGADESWRSVSAGCNGQPEYAPSVRFSIVHHTETSNSYAPGDTAAILRGIYHFHTHVNGWCDVGYNFLVDRYGQVFEGRAGGITRPVVGAHAQGFNSGSTGVATVGSFTSAPVPAEMYASLRAILAWKLEFHSVDPLSAVSAGGRAVAAVSGHRDLNPTDCPGDVLYGMLPQLRSELSGMIGTGSRSVLQALHSGKAIDVPAASSTPGTQIVQWAWNGGLNQQWRLEPLATDVYRIVSVSSGLVLDVAEGSTANGARVIQWPWTGGLNQAWAAFPFSKLTPGGNPNVYIIVSMSSGKVLDVARASTENGTWLVQFPWNGGYNQVWFRTTL